jgi:hypothetical protein
MLRFVPVVGTTVEESCAMPLFQHPLRPMSGLGRVMWCLALSVMAALMLMLSPPTHADELPPVATQVDVRIAGDIADVTVTRRHPSGVLEVARFTERLAVVDQEYGLVVRDVSDFALQVALDTPLAVREVRSPTHDIVVTGAGTREASVSLDDSRANAAARPDNRDFVLRYRLAGG